MQRIEFGPVIRKLREQAGLNQRELAGKVGIDVSYLSKIENGVVQPPSQELIIKLANALGADKDELLTLAEEVSGQDLDSFSRQWLYSKKLPDMPEP